MKKYGEVSLIRCIYMLTCVIDSVAITTLAGGIHVACVTQRNPAVKVVVMMEVR